MKEISVIIPTADRAEKTLSLLQRLTQQTLKPKEVIVVDNGIHKLKVNHNQFSLEILVIRTEPRIGASRARNIGAKSASCDYLAFIDDDDFWEPDYLEMVMQSFQETNADAVVGQLMRKKQTNQTVKPYKQFPKNIQHQRSVFYSNPGFGGQNLTIKRKVFLNLNGFDETMPASVDRDLAARLILSNRKIAVQPAAKSILCDHDGARVRHSIVKGNFLFIKKHWRNMYPSELYKAITKLLRRSVNSFIKL